MWMYVDYTMAKRSFKRPADKFEELQEAFLEAEAANTDSKATHCTWSDKMLVNSVWKALSGEQS